MLSFQTTTITCIGTLKIEVLHNTAITEMAMHIYVHVLISL